MAKDSIGREWQVATIQLDMNMPERFDLFCINEKGEQERIVMIHAAIMGSIERFLAVLIEHFAGNFPVWMAPVQAVVIPVGEKFSDYGKKIFDALATADVRAEFSEPTESLGKRIREAETMKIPYILVVGEKEESAKTVNVRSRKSKDGEEISIDAFVKKIQQEIKDKSL